MSVKRNIQSLQKKMLRKKYGAVPILFLSFVPSLSWPLGSEDIEKWHSFLSKFDRVYSKYRSGLLQATVIISILIFLSITIYNHWKPDELADEDDISVCHMAVHHLDNVWDTASYYEKFVNAAKTKGLSLDDCLRIIGRRTTK